MRGNLALGGGYRLIEYYSGGSALGCEGVLGVWVLDSDYSLKYVSLAGKIYIYIYIYGLNREV